MEIKIIYTFDDRPQEITRIKINDFILQDKNVFFMFATSTLSDVKKAKLVKLSTLIMVESGDAPIVMTPGNEWWYECQGKFWDDEIPFLMQKYWGVTCDYVPLNQ